MSFGWNLASKKLGFETLNTEIADPATRMNAITDGYGFDTVVVAAGAPAALKLAISLVSQGRPGHRHRYLPGGRVLTRLGSGSSADLSQGILWVILETLRRGDPAPEGKNG